MNKDSRYKTARKFNYRFYIKNTRAYKTDKILLTLIACFWFLFLLPILGLKSILVFIGVMFAYKVLLTIIN